MEDETAFLRDHRSLKSVDCIHRWEEEIGPFLLMVFLHINNLSQKLRRHTPASSIGSFNRCSFLIQSNDDPHQQIRRQLQIQRAANLKSHQLKLTSLLGQPVQRSLDLEIVIPLLKKR